MASLMWSSTNRASSDAPQVVSTPSLEVSKRRLNEDFHITNVRTGIEIFVKLHQSVTHECHNTMNPAGYLFSCFGF